MGDLEKGEGSSSYYFECWISTMSTFSPVAHFIYLECIAFIINLSIEYHADSKTDNWTENENADRKLSI